MERIKLMEKHIYTGNLILVNAAHPLRVKPDENRLLRIQRGPSAEGCTHTQRELPTVRQGQAQTQGELPTVRQGQAQTQGEFPTVRQTRALTTKEREEVRLTQSAGKLLLHLLDCIDHRSQIVVTSGYRTRREQQDIYEESLRDNGKEFTAQYVALPDCSEHQTGLAVDLAKDSRWIDPIRPDFPDHGICQTFREKAPEFGFIERYPEGKEDKTKIAQEPWHFRYVGFPHSVIMAERGMVLEEYMEFLKNFPVGKPPFVFEKAGTNIEICYLPIRKKTGGEAFLTLPEKEPFQLSGNNCDGLILTLWREYGASEPIQNIGTDAEHRNRYRTSEPMQNIGTDKEHRKECDR